MKRKRPTLADEIRSALANCGKSRYRVSKETGISQAMLCKFALGKGWFSERTFNKLADYLGLHVTTIKGE